ncbi:ATP-binding cassette domain-containing protein [Rickettsiaceae bacterium]|nr:ATP-binding cassette domain-containing protein [Rickettsiaceae bacterium]
MTSATVVDIVAEEGQANYIETDQIDSLLELFDMHNLIPKMSKHEHVYATSLAMLVTSMHWSGDVRHLFESLPYTKGREIDLLDILNTMANLGFSAHEMNMSLKEIDDRLMPCMFIPDKKGAAPLVLLSKKDGLITAFNSKKKQKIEFRAKNVKGTAYFFDRMNAERIQEEKETKKAAGMNWFNIIFSRFKPVLQEIVLTSLFINILALAMPLFIMSIYDKVIGSGSTTTLKYLVIGVGIAVFAESILRIIRLRSVVWLGVRLDNIVSNTIFERLLLMKAAYTEGASISAQISRVKSFESVRKFFTGPLFSVIVELPFTIILLITIWLLTGPLVYIPLVVVALFVLLLYYYQFKLRVAMRGAARTSSNRQQHGMETFIKMHALHHNGMARNWWLKYKEKLSNSSNASFKTNMISSVIESAAHAISMASGIAVIGFGVHLIWDGSITIGALVATMILIWRVLGPLQTICSMLPRLEQLKNSIDQINRLTNIEVERQPTILKRPVKNIKGAVKLTNIGLRYSTEIEPIFVGLDIEIEPGEVIAITGGNGSGKSSLLKILNGLYRPQTGTVRIDATNIKQLEPIELRNYIAYLPQIPNFFEGTIKENLLLVNPLATDAEINQALIDATAMDEIESLKDGIETVIRGNNPALPSGFIYTLNLARVFLKAKSNFMLLDELPNASLNEDAGSAYKNLITSAKGKKTTFFVSQRDDFIKLADRVIVLRPGNRPAILKSEEFINKYG